MTFGRVMVLGDEARSTLSVIRSLGRAGLEVHWGGAEPDGVPARSRYVKDRHLLDGDWVPVLSAIVDRIGFDLVIPTTDEVAIPLDAARDRISVKLALPPPEAFAIVQHKARTTALARGLGVPVPEEIVLGGGEGAERVPDWPFPLIVKPASSFTEASLATRHQVERVFDREGLERALATRDPALEVVVQREVPGIGGGLEILAVGGDILYAFQHRRLHEPERGGGSSFRESVPVDPTLLEHGRRLARALRYTGVAMIEVREHGGAYTLLEINGRFWGSLPLAIAAGADFPHFLYRALVEGRRDFPAGYAYGVRSRNLGKDAGWWVERARRDGIVFTLPVAAKELAELALRGEKSDTFAGDDLQPALADLAELGKKAGLKLWQRLGSEALRIPALSERRGVALSTTLARSARVLFVCKGNLARSPFAAAVLERLAPNRYEIRSAGFKTHAGRASPPEVVRAASALGLDLSAHRARALSPEDLAWADIVLVFDDLGRAAVPGDTVHDLSAFAPPRLADPYGRPEGEARALFERIEDALATALRNGKGA
jgi:protein-tyrosine-phosphatase/predicted ATP-grasp superfamily ATP-dependent carboligase